MADASIALPTQDFRHLVSIASMVVERRNTIPILSMLRCRANGSFEVAGTDLDMIVSAKIDHGGGPEGSFMLAGAPAIARAAGSTGAASIELTPGTGNVAIVAGALLITTSNSQSVDDFPGTVGDMASEAFTASLSHAQLRSIARIAAAISGEETRYYLNGIYLHQVAGTLFRAAATDGHRLCTIDLELPDAVGELPGIIIPRKSIRLLLSLAGRPAPEDGGIRLVVGGVNAPNRIDGTAPERAANLSRISASMRAGRADVCVASKLIDGTYPDYARVVPAGTGKSFLFEAAELRSAVNSLRQLATGNVRAVKMTADEGGMTLSAKYLDPGFDSAIRIACRHSHSGFECAFNGGNLLSMVEAAGAGEIVLNIEDPAAPALIRNPADTAWTGVLMPMRF